jgi:beta-barrel assembly-enhancing protease
MATEPRLPARRALLGGLCGCCGLFLAGSAARAQISVNLGSLKGLSRMAKAASLDEKDEVEMGGKLFGPFVDASGGAYRNRAVQQAVARIAEPVFATSQRRALKYEIAVVDSNEVNAWCLPGGKVGVNKGLLRYADSEDEIAAVIAHEMGHAELSHQAKAMRQKAFMAGLGAAASAAAAASDDDAPIGTGAGMASLDLALYGLITSGYSREAEREADQQIVKAFQRTGHDVARGARIYATLMALAPQKSKWRSSLFAGHPETAERLAALSASASAGAGARPVSDSFVAIKTAFPTRRVAQRAQQG